MVLSYGCKIWYCSGNCKTIQEPVGNLVVQNLLLYGFTIWLLKFISSGKWETVWKPCGKFVVKNSFLYGNEYISIWNRGMFT